MNNCKNLRREKDTTKKKAKWNGKNLITIERCDVLIYLGQDFVENENEKIKVLNRLNEKNLTPQVSKFYKLDFSKTKLIVFRKFLKEFSIF